MTRPTVSGFRLLAAVATSVLLSLALLPAPVAAQPLDGVGLVVSAEAVGAPFSAGGDGRYDVMVRNDGDEASSGPIAVEVLDSHGQTLTSLSGSGWVCALEAGRCVHTSAVAPGVSLPVITAVYEVTPSAVPQMWLRAWLTNDSDAAGEDFVQVDTDVLAPVDLVPHLAGPDEVVANGLVSYTVTVGNDGSEGTVGVDLTVSLWTGMTLDASSGTGWTCVGDATVQCRHDGAVGAGSESPELTLEVAVAADAYPEAYVVVQATSDDELARGNPYNNTVDLALPVVGVADLVVDLTTADEFTVGTSAQYTVAVRNVGTVTATGTTTATVEVQPGLTLVDATGAGWTCAVTGAAVCEHPGPVLAGASLPPLTLAADVGPSGVAYREATATIARDGDPDVTISGLHNSAHRLTPIVGGPDLSLSLEALDSAAPTRALRLRYRVHNSGDETSAAAVVTTPLPDGLTFDSFAGTGWDCASGAGELTCTAAGGVPAAASLDDLVVTLLLDAATAGDDIEVAATVTIDGEVAPTDNSTALLLSVAQAVDVSVSAGLPSPLSVGSDAELTIHVVNVGGLEVPGPLEVRAELPSGLTYRSVAGTGWTCTPDDATVSCQRLAALGFGDTTSLVLTVGVGRDALDDVTVSVTVDVDGDTGANNDETTAYAAVVNPVDLVATVSGPSQIRVGEPALFTITVRNNGTDASSGAIQLVATLGPGISLRDGSATAWTCATAGATVTCTRTTPLGPGAASDVSLFLVADATAGSETSVTFAVAGGGDATRDNNTATATVPVVLGPAPQAAFTAVPTVGAAPLSVSFDAGSSTGAITSYAWEFGDGTTGTGEVVGHTYTHAGIYTAVLTVGDGARTSRATRRIIAATGGSALSADAGGDRVVTQGEPAIFDGSGSRPLSRISQFAWDFGDGSTATGRRVSHTYDEPGQYTASLTVSDGALDDTDTVSVTVEPVQPGLTVLVTGGGSPLDGADVVVTDSSGRRHAAVTDAKGEAVLATLEDGDYTVYAHAPDYVPNRASATVVDGAGEVTVALVEGDVGSTLLESRSLTVDEIEALGVDPNDPANQHVVAFEVLLVVYGREITVTTYVNEEQEVLDVEGDDEECPPDADDCGAFGFGGGLVGTVRARTVAGRETLIWLITGSASFLKEFFEISLIVTNLAPEGFTFVEGAAELVLPDGLALAPTNSPQDSIVEMQDIAGGADASATWIVRGDRSGSYILEANYTGVLDPIGAPIQLDARSAVPLRVWGGDAVQLIVEADNKAFAHFPYRARLGLKNVSPTPVYNPRIALGERPANTVAPPCGGVEGSVGTASIAPGETWWSEELTYLSTINGQLNLSESYVKQTAGEQDVATELRPRVPARTPDTAPRPQRDGDNVTYPPVPGATQYQVYTSVSPNGPFEPAGPPSATPSAPRGARGKYYVLCADGQQVSAVEQLDPPEPVTVSFTAEPAADDTLTVRLTATTSRAVKSYRWLVDGQQIGATRSFTHTFDAAGRYDVTLEVTDDEGEKTEVIQLVAVVETIVIEAKIWIPHSVVVDPVIPLDVQWPGLLTPVVPDAYRSCFTSEPVIQSRLHGDGHTNYGSRGMKPSAVADYRAVGVLEMEWDGEVLREVRAHGNFGESHRIFRPNGPSSCTQSRTQVATALAHPRVTGPREFAFDMSGDLPLTPKSVGDLGWLKDLCNSDLSIPFVSSDKACTALDAIVLTPPFDFDVTGEIDPDTGELTLAYQTDMFPSYGLRIVRNGRELTARPIHVADCVSVDGLSGAAWLAVALNTTLAPRYSGSFTIGSTPEQGPAAPCNANPAPAALEQRLNHLRGIKNIEQGLQAATLYATTLDGDKLRWDRLGEGIGNVFDPEGRLLRVKRGGLLPDSPVRLELFSEPVEVCRTAADTNGVVDVQFDVPASVPAGEHTLVMDATDVDGTTLVLTESVTVPAATPGAPTAGCRPSANPGLSDGGSGPVPDPPRGPEGPHGGIPPGLAACHEAPTPFADVTPTNVHAGAISCAVELGLVRGTTSTTYSPRTAVTRGQLASMLVRLLALTGVHLADNPADAFDDDNGRTHERAINQLAEAGILRGIGARTFAPSTPVSRGQMMTMLVQTIAAAGIDLDAGRDAFDDDDGTAHESFINTAAAAAIASGTGPRRFSPHRAVLRDQTASFLTRTASRLLPNS